MIPFLPYDGSSSITKSSFYLKFLLITSILYTSNRQDVRQRPKYQHRIQKLPTFAHRYTTAAGRASYPAIKGELDMPVDYRNSRVPLETIAISALEKSTRLLAESIALLQNHTQEDQDNPVTLTRQKDIHDDDLKAADALQPSTVARIGSAVHACNLENITVGKESQQTIILEGRGSIRARNITTGDGSVQLVGVSDIHSSLTNSIAKIFVHIVSPS
ncbi:Malic acid transport protein [Fusarium oxysporum f. sp. albedinis]|nr:Malic acid transport protein [Fusarium oxysporum f. sp. albedinis]